jgi:uncharacterized membrane protein YebE (DUF533 family)
MTNQEIYNRLGEMGTLMALFLEMGAIDGHLDDSEINQVIKVSELFTNQDLKPFIDSAIEIRNEIGQKEVINYLKAGLTYFGDKFDEETKQGILIALKSIAQADGVIHGNEKLLFDLAVNNLGL